LKLGTVLADLPGEGSHTRLPGPGSAALQRHGPAAGGQQRLLPHRRRGGSGRLVLDRGRQTDEWFRRNAETIRPRTVGWVSGLSRATATAAQNIRQQPAPSI
jgi:hypothetical protein